MQGIIQTTTREQLVNVVSPVPKEVWHLHYTQDPRALVTQSPQWTNALCALEGYRDVSRWYQFADGQQVVLPLVVRRFGGMFKSGGSMPQHWGYGGVLCTQPLHPVHVRLIWEDLRALGWQYIHIRPNPLSADAWENGRISAVQSSPKCAHVLHLPDTFDTVWKNSFASSTRRNVRKAEKSGLVVETDSTGRLVPVFYDLFQQSVLRWAEKQNEPKWLATWRSQRRDPLSKFQQLAHSLGAQCTLWVAWYQGEPAAAILVLQDKNAHYTRGAMNMELANETRANDLLHKLAIEAACQHGCPTYHMGETGDSASLAQFKEKFGAQPYPYAEYQLEKLPLTTIDKQLRTAVKQLIGFKDT